tara:strand:+ start:3053 stop:3178 length:126 start_codon:yes stop_codon:yes gene_type:complete
MFDFIVAEEKAPANRIPATEGRLNKATPILYKMEFQNSIFW